MDENRICPVCQNDLPEDSKFFCPQCISEMNWLDNAKDIPERKNSFDRKELPPPLSQTPKRPNRVMAVLSIIAGLSLITCWLPTWGVMLIECWIGGLNCPGKLILPGIVGILLLVAGLVEGIRSIINK